jgi:hypothetical protein
MDPQMTSAETKYSVEEIRCHRFNVYYRVMADGVAFPSTVYITPSQKTARTTEQLKTWCKQNSHRLADEQVVQADLSGSPQRTASSVSWLTSTPVRWIYESDFFQSLIRDVKSARISNRLRSIH